MSFFQQLYLQRQRHCSPHTTSPPSLVKAAGEMNRVGGFHCGRSWIMGEFTGLLFTDSA